MRANVADPCRPEQWREASDNLHTAGVRSVRVRVRGEGRSGAVARFFEVVAVAVAALIVVLSAEAMASTVLAATTCTPCNMHYTSCKSNRTY